MTDREQREQIRRDARLMLQPHQPGCQCDLHAMPKLAGWIDTLARHCLALLDELEQAETEVARRDADLRETTSRMIELVAECESRLSRVSALVEALREIAVDDGGWRTDVARQALAAFEGEQ